MYNNTDDMFSMGSSLLATLVTDKLKLPITMIAVLNPLISHIMYGIRSLDFTIPTINSIDFPVEFFILILIPVLLYFSLKWVCRLGFLMGITDNYYICIFRTYLSKLNGKYTYTVADPKDLFTFVNMWLYNNYCFIEPYPAIFLMKEKQQQFKVGEKNEYYERLIVPAFNKRFYFRDTLFNVNGYIYFEYYEVQSIRSVDKSIYNDKNTVVRTETSYEKISLPHVKMHICVNQPPKKYFDNCLKQVNSKPTRYMQTDKYVFDVDDNRYYSIGLNTFTTDQPIARHLKLTLEEREKIYIDTFFHPLTNQIWRDIRNVVFDTDKLLRLGLNTQFIACFHGPPGTGKSSFLERIIRCTGRDSYRPDIKVFNSKSQTIKLFTTYPTGVSGSKQFIIVLDEFDRIIQHIIDRQQDLCRKIQLKNNILNKLSTGDFQDLCEEPHGNKPKTLNVDIKNALNIDKDNDDILLIDDLLDIIQGAINQQSTVIIATTNNYAKISNLCPRLFRDGRFKPIYFGYPTRVTMDKISQFYYNRNITNDIDIPDVVKIPTARILTHIKGILALSDNIEERYKCFLKKMQYDFNYYKFSDKFTNYDSFMDSEDLTSNDSV